MNEIAIQDANILIDLVSSGLFDHCLALPYLFITTDIILDELYPEQVAIIQPHINSGKFLLAGVTPEDLEAIALLRLEDTRLSEQDWSAYYYAHKKQAILLTGDKRLRTLSAERGLQVKGVIWLLDELVNTEIVTKKEAYHFLQKLMVKNKRLPTEECAIRLELWGTNGV